jgi:cyclopropane-fatty-acyl-phospholipid synthase
MQARLACAAAQHAQGSRRNIAAHYDLSNDFYQLFLDETMTYSCGIFERPDSTLTEASIAKLDRICRKLDLHASDHVSKSVPAGAASPSTPPNITAAASPRRRYPPSSTNWPSSASMSRARRPHHLLQRDYRDLEGQYDKLVSIEMIEAIGWQYYDDLLPQVQRACSSPMAWPASRRSRWPTAITSRRSARWITSNAISFPAVASPRSVR